MTSKKCPMCAEEIPAEAAVCPYCSTPLVESAVQAAPPPVRPVAPPPPAPPVRKQNLAWLWILGGVLAVVILAGIGAVVLLTSGALTPSPCQSIPNADWSQKYSDPFSTDKGWWMTGYINDEWGTSTVSIENGAYRVEATAKQAYFLFDADGFRKMDISDFCVTMDTRHVSGPNSAEMGLTFRFVDWDNHYFAGITKGGRFYLGMAYRGELVMFVDTPLAGYQPGQTNQMTVAMVGQNITVFVNGEQVADKYNGAFSSGTLNVYVWLERDGDKGVFELDNFVLQVP